MTEGQRDIDEARSQLQAAEELEKLMLRLREMPAILPCEYCAKPVRQDAYCCDRCGWKVAV